MGSADPPLAVHCLYGDRHRQLRRHSKGGRDASALGDLLAAAPARLAAVHRSVLVRAAVCHQVAQRATHRLNGIPEHHIARQGRKATPGEAGNMKKSRSKKAESPSELIDARIEDLGDWRGEMLSRLRALIKEADPEVAEEWKWRGTPVWSHNGLICTGDDVQECREDDLRQGSIPEGP